MDFYLYNRTSEILKDFEYINEGVDFKKMITFDLAYYLLNNKNIISKIKYIIKLFFPFKCIGFWDGFVNNKIVNQMITIEQLKDVKERTDALRRYL